MKNRRERGAGAVRGGVGSAASAASSPNVASSPDAANAKKSHKAALSILALAISITLFVASLFSLAWAMDATQQKNKAQNANENLQDQQATKDNSLENAASSNDAQSAEQSSLQKNTQEGQEVQGPQIKENSENLEATSEDDDTAGALKLDAKDLYKDASEKENKSDKSNGKKAAKSYKSKKAASKKTKSNSSTKSSKIYHSKFWREPVYKTIKHYAAKVKSKVKDGKVTLSWVYCKTCGKNHKSSYSETMLDHYIKHYCEICGKKHTQGYYE